MNVQVPCTPSSSPAASSPSPSPSPSPSSSPSTATVTYSLPAVSVQAPFTNVQVGRKLSNIKVDVAVEKKGGKDISVSTPFTEVSVKGRKLKDVQDMAVRAGPWATVDVDGGVSVAAPYTNVEVPEGRRLRNVNVDVAVGKKGGKDISVSAPFTEVSVKGRKLKDVQDVAVRAGPWATVDVDNGVRVAAPYTNVYVPGRKLHNVDAPVELKQGGAVSVEAAVNTGRKLHDTLTKVGDIASVDVKGAAVSVEAAGVSVNTGNRKLQDVNVSVDLQKKPGQSPVVDPALIKVDIVTIVGVDVKVGRRLNGTPAAAAQGTVREH
ncbi:hypothetical protein OEZ86_001840 [Tetradesmus obliquus]|nr:hypothetical protein OEZ86_001840 [Tetradesmus obliquus]